MIPVVQSAVRNSSCVVTNWLKISRPTFKLLKKTYSSSLDYDQKPEKSEVSAGGKKISKAMQAYIERAQQYDAFMKKERTEYQIGKRHLANMMGEDPEMFTQEDIDKAIEYLFPSGLFESKARPIMKPPEEVFPPQKAAEFDESGRPYHFLFYTGKSDFFKILYDVVEILKNLNKFEDNMIRKHLTPDPSQTLTMSGSEWLPQDMLEHKLVEKLHESDYKSFQAAFDRLLSHPYSYRVKDFIEEYRKPLMSQNIIQTIPELLYDESGRPYITTTNCLRKRAWAEVTVRGLGSGKITINNGKSLDYFSEIQSREQVIFPLLLTNMLKKVDVDAIVRGGGTSSQAGAIRWGIATGLCSFVDSETTEKMRLAGLLTRDYRKPERKKPGQEGARRKFTWKKR